MRRIFEKVVDYPFAVILFIVSLMLIGSYVLFERIHIEREPNLVIPYIMISVPYPGATPSEVELKITKKIEDKLKGLDDVDYIQSVSYENGSLIVLKFLTSKNVEKTKRKVKDIVDVVKVDFPKDSEEPLVEGLTFDDTAVLLITVTSQEQPANLHLLKKIADKIKRELEGIPGVADILLYGGLEKEIHIEVEPQLAKQYGLTISDVSDIIKSEHLNLPVGSVESERKTLLLKTSGKYSDFLKLSNLKIKVSNADSRLTEPINAEVPLSKIAKITSSNKKISSFSRFNSSPAVTLIVKRKSEINVLKTVNILKQRLKSIQESLPEGILVGTMHDSSSDIRMMLKQLGSSAIYGAMLVVLVLIFVLGFRNALLVSFAIPFTLVFGATFLYLFGYSINTMTIFAMIVILGIVVDGAIIVAENIHRHIEEGKDALQAAKDGIAEVGPAVFIADLTTICAFLPIAFLSGITGEYMKLLPITVIITLIGSLIIDHFGLPAIGARLMKPLGLSAKKMFETIKTLPKKLTAKMKLPSTRFRMRVRDIAKRKFSSADTEKIAKNILEPPVNKEDLFLITGQEIEQFDVFMHESEDPESEEEFKRLIVQRIKHAETTKSQVADKKYEQESSSQEESYKNIQGVRRWKLDYKGILEASEDLKNAILAEMHKEDNFDDNQLKRKIFASDSEVIDSFVKEIITVKDSQEKGAITSFWAKGEEPFVKKKHKIGFEDDGRIIIPERAKYETKELLLDQKDLELDAKKHITAKREKDRLIEGASPFIKFGRQKYESLINFMLKVRYIFFFVIFLAAVAAITAILTGTIAVEYMPSIDRGRFFINLEMPSSTPLTKTSQVLGAIEHNLEKIINEQKRRGMTPEIKSYVSTVGNTNALIADLRESSESGPNFGKVQIELIEPEKRERSQSEIIRELREKIPQMIDAKITVDEVFEGPMTGSDISLKVQGENLDEMQRVSEIIKNMLTNIPGTKDVRVDFARAHPEMQLTVNKTKAAKFNVSTSEISKVVRTAIFGEESGQFDVNDEEIKIITKLINAEEKDFEKLAQLPVRNNFGLLLPLSEVTDFKFSNVPQKINRYDLRRAITIRCSLEKGYRASEIERTLQAQINQDKNLQTIMQGQMFIKFVGETLERDRSFEELAIAMVIAILLILFILALYFNSARISFIILINIPLGFIGAVFGLYVTNNSFNVLSFIGIIALMGIVVNDAIVLVDYIRDARNKGFSVKNSIIKAGQARLRPVLLTTITTIAGLLPLTLNITGGAEFWQSLCVAIVFGIAFATILTLVVLPLLFYEFFRKSSTQV